LTFLFLLEFAPVEIATAEVSAVELPDTCYGSNTHHVADFSFNDSLLILLTYTKEDRFKNQSDAHRILLHEPRLVLYDEERKQDIHQLSLDDGIELYTDYLDETFVLGKTGVSHIHPSENRLFLEPVNQEDFEAHITPAFDSLNQHLLFSTWTSDFPSFDYIGYDLKDSVQTHIQHIEDSEQMAMLRSEYKYLSPRNKLNAYRLELQTGIDKEIIAAKMTGFAHSQYFEPLYAPAFVIGDSLYIFNHPENYIEIYNAERERIDSTSTEYLQDKQVRHWENKLLHDRASGKVYALYSRHGYGYIREVDLQTGSTKDAQRLCFRYPENVKIHKSKVYYTYRPFESPQKKYLYSERIH
jgi:hypothetical protein